ncbi:hypothetical protein WJX74_002434 [Apatococcus lobatus]|uniref:PPPDE domain-containing protein n=2 Tax=Apatococcus TaxID=904362 RepID=A0AAW1QCB1_9CHLO
MTRVVLNVYDLADTYNSWTYWCGVGVFHSGVEVYGVEYAFGGHDLDISGVFATSPKDAPGPVVYRESVVVGETSASPEEVQQIVQRLGDKFRGTSYHLLQRNCNHFSDMLCERLTGHQAPLWINRLASWAVMLHCLLPPGWVPPLHPPSIQPSLENEAKHRTEEWQSLLTEQAQRSDQSRSFSTSTVSLPAPGGLSVRS